MNLNSTNIPYILKRLACCITNLSSKLYGYSQIGNKDCFEDTTENILILNNIYEILDNNYNITYPSYRLYLNSPFNPTVCVCTIIDNSTGTILATGYNTGIVSVPTSINALQVALSILSTNDPCWKYNGIFNPGNIKRVITYNNLTLFLSNICNCSSNITIHFYIPFVASPPYGGINTNIIVQELGTYDLSNSFIPGNCSNKKCFTEDQLNDLYQQSLNLCKDCNCN